MWAIVLIPDVSRRFNNRAKADSIGAFSRSLDVLNGAPARNHRPVASFGPSRSLGGPQLGPVSGPPLQGTPRTRAQAQQRRKDVLAALIGFALVSFLGAITVGGPLLMVHVLADLLLVGFIGLTLSITRRDRARANVVSLPSVSTQLRPVAAYSGDRERIAR